MGASLKPESNPAPLMNNHDACHHSNPNFLSFEPPSDLQRSELRVALLQWNDFRVGSRPQNQELKKGM